MSWSNRQSPSVTMSSPATSCSRRYTDSASTYCSRNRDVTIASRNDRVPRFSVYQLGRGSEPVIVVGSVIPAVAFNMCESSSLNEMHRDTEISLSVSRAQYCCAGTIKRSGACDFLPHQRSALGERVELHLRHHARQRLHAAVGAQHHLIRRHCGDDFLDARGNRLRRLDGIGTDVEHTDLHGLVLGQ